ncbi:MAG: PAS domain S-box protein [Bacteroidales bacterium]|nr:PAS domain S-box protein [Bacteroidales bacterium]
MSSENNSSYQPFSFRQKAGELIKSVLKKNGTFLAEDEILKLTHELELARIESDLHGNEQEIIANNDQYGIPEELFRQFLENSPVYIFFKDENIRSIYLSPNYEELLGKPLNELLGKSMNEIFPSALAAEMIANDLKILKEGKKIIVEEEFNGRYFSTIKFPVRIKGKPDLLAGFTTDITESQRSRLALIKSEAKYRKLHESMRDGFVYVSMEGTILESNTVYQEMLGYTHPELEKMSYFDITPEKWHDPENRIVAEHILPQGFSPVYEKEYRRKDGTVFPVELRTFLIKNDENMPCGMWAIVRDITERKKVVEALRASEEKFKSIVESSPSAMYFYRLQNDKRLILTGANSAADKTIGIAHQTLIGKTLEEAFPNLVGTEIPEIYKKVAAGTLNHQSFEIEYKDDRFAGIYSVSVFKTGTNTIAVSFNDISYKKKTEEILRQNEARLIELNSTKDKFFSIIAHDLKSPFTAILGFSNLLATQVQNKNLDDIQVYTDNILQASHRVLDLLNNIQEWSGTQTGRLNFKPTLFNFEALVNGTVQLLKNNAYEKSIFIKSEISFSEPIFADKAMINTVLRNLVNNAIKFTNRGGEIVVSAAIQQNEVLVVVADNGVGIPKQDIYKLFRIDQNYSTPGTNNEKGTGLGLILCKEFVEKHEGKIWVESEEGQGSRFCFSIPTKK